MVDEFALEHDSLILADHHATMFQNLAITFNWIFQQGCTLIMTTVQDFCVYVRICCIVCGNKFFHMG